MKKRSPKPGSSNNKNNMTWRLVSLNGVEFGLLVGLFLCLSVCISVCLCVSLPACQPVYLPVSVAGRAPAIALVCRKYISWALDVTPSAT